MCSRNEDLPRFIEFYEKQIKEGQLELTKAFAKSKGKVSLLPDEKVEAKAAKKQLQKKKESNMADLEKMILAKRENTFNSFLSTMEKKYCQEDSNEKKRKNPQKPEEVKKRRKKDV